MDILIFTCRVETIVSTWHKNGFLERIGFSSSRCPYFFGSHSSNIYIYIANICVCVYTKCVDLQEKEVLNKNKNI